MGREQVSLRCPFPKGNVSQGEAPVPALWGRNGSESSRRGSCNSASLSCALVELLSGSWPLRECKQNSKRDLKFVSAKASAAMFPDAVADPL